MPLSSSLSALRLRPLPTPSAFLRRASSRIAIAASLSSSRDSPRKPAPDKNLLKARDAVKDLRAAPSPLADDDDLRRRLLPSQAVGLVAAAQANFMRVIVESAGGPPDNTGFLGNDPRVGRELLCVVRALLKKIKRRVLVGDKVLVGSIDWVDRRGMIEDVCKRGSEILEPPMANVDHLLVLFSMDQPKPEPFTLTRFLVEAESTGLPLTLAMNKSELVGDKTTVIVGSSGVGKSSFINSLRLTLGISDEVEINKLLEQFEQSKWLGEQRVGDVSKRSGRGKHTTRHVSLLPLFGGGYLADTPGFNQPSLIKVTKKSIAEMFPEILSAWKERLHGWGYKPLFCSVEQESGLTALEEILKHQTTVIVGPSGVGKSSLINSLRLTLGISDEEEINKLLEQFEQSKWLGEQRVGDVSKRSGRGKHTTRHVSLLPLSGGGYLADTPGFNQPSLIKVTKKSLAEMFPEIREMLIASEPLKCAFNDCLHLGEPGCIVKADWERYPYYLQLLDEIKIREEFQLRTIGTKREADVRYKVRDRGVIRAEPRLEPKKHRRMSRKRLNQSILHDLDDVDLEDLDDYWSDSEKSVR